jgi:hypothetical protein
MTRHALAGVLLTALLAGPAASGENNAPKLTQATKDGARITSENIVKMKLRQVQLQTPPAPSPPLAPPPLPSVN